MAVSLKLSNYSIVSLLNLILTIYLQCGLSQGVTCVPENNCRCTLDDGTRRYFDFSPISRKDEPYFQSGEPGYIDYYDPCEPFTVDASGGVCDGVAACQENQAEGTTYTKVAMHNRVTFSYNDQVGESVILNYDNGESGDNLVVLSVIYNCNGAPVTTFAVIASTPSSIQYMISSPFGCLMNKVKTSKGLSGGSILCITFSVGVVVYLVGGFMFTSLVLHKSGKEAIPNYDFWIEFPGLIKEGASFTTSCVTRKTGYEEHAPDNQEGADTFGGGDGGGGDGGGGSGSSSTGKTGYDAI